MEPGCSAVQVFDTLVQTLSHTPTTLPAGASLVPEKTRAHAGEVSYASHMIQIRGFGKMREPQIPSFQPVPFLIPMEMTLQSTFWSKSGVGGSVKDQCPTSPSGTWLLTLE